jgi:hypothetical protein
MERVAPRRRGRKRLRDLGFERPDSVSVLLRGHSEGFSTERLMKLLNRLGQDIDIVVRSHRGARRPARVRVVCSDDAKPRDLSSWRDRE